MCQLTFFFMFNPVIIHGKHYVPFDYVILIVSSITTVQNVWVGGDKT